MFAGARRDGGGELVRIGTKADDSPVPRRRAIRIVFPIAIGAIVLAAVIVLVRASFDSDEPQARSALAARRASSSPSSSRGPGQAVGGPAAARAGAAPETAGGTPAPAGLQGAPASAGAPAGGAAPGAGPSDSPVREGLPGEAHATTGPAPAGNPPPGPRPGLHAGALLAGKEAARTGGVAGRTGAGANIGAGGAGGGRAAETRVALAAESSRRDAPWRRPPSEEDASSKLVARFAPSGGATLRGRVVDAESGRPSIGVGIEAHIGDAFMRTISDNAGAFKMSGMLPGRKITVWIIGRTDTFVAERIDVTSPGEGETADAGVVRLLRGDELAAHLEGWMGMFVSRRGRRNVVAAVSPWSPADRAGIQVGDVLLSIEGRDVDGLGPRATGFLLRGPVGTRASVAIQSRDGVVQRYQLERVLR